MSLTTPTTKQISDNIISQLELSLNQTIPLLPKSFNRVLSKALAAVFVLLYKYAGFIFLQMFVSKASDQETVVNGITITPLTEWGRIIGVGDPASATSAEFVIDVTVTNQIGSLISGTQLLNNSNGVTYLVIGDVLLNAPTIQATIRASSDQSGGDGSGSIGNLDVGAIVSFANPLANVSRDAVIASQTVQGVDGETTAAYRQRIIDRWQKVPQGGAYVDYELWGEEPNGIINVYPYTGLPGQIDVYAEATPESSGDPDGIPTSAQLLAVYNSIQLDDGLLATRRPANAYVNVYAITRTPFTVRVLGLTVDNAGAVQTSIEEAVDEYLRDRAPFIEGLSIPPRKDQINRSAISGVVNDVVSAAGGFFTNVLLYVAGNPIELYFVGEGEKAKSGGVTFV